MGQSLSLQEDLFEERSAPSAHALVHGLHSRSLFWKVAAIGSCILFGSTNLFAATGDAYYADQNMAVAFASELAVSDTGFVSNMPVVTDSPEPQPQEVSSLIATKVEGKAEPAKKTAPAANKNNKKTAPATKKGAIAKVEILKSTKGTGKCGISMVWPVAAATRLSQGFSGRHTGMDISYKSQNNTALPIVAAAAGKVVEAKTSGWNGGYGNVIVIDHGNGYMTRYGHNSKVLVKVGDKVESGQKIAVMGRSGRVYGMTGIHLHFELVKSGKRMNPSSCYAK